MDETKILLGNTSNEEERFQAATSIINSYGLCLQSNQILKAFQKIRRESDYREEDMQRCIFLLVELLNININMYIAIMLALNDCYFKPLWLTDLKVLNYDGDKRIDITHLEYNVTGLCCELLNYYDFDLGSVVIHYSNKKFIQEYRDNKYGGKMTKPAIKKND